MEEKEDEEKGKGSGRGRGRRIIVSLPPLLSCPAVEIHVCFLPRETITLSGTSFFALFLHLFFPRQRPRRRSHASLHSKSIIMPIRRSSVLVHRRPFSLPYKNRRPAPSFSAHSSQFSPPPPPFPPSSEAAERS